VDNPRDAMNPSGKYPARISMIENSKSVEIPSMEIYMDGGCEPNPGPGGGMVGQPLSHPMKYN
jgi:hypothetical protein